MRTRTVLVNVIAAASVLLMLSACATSPHTAVSPHPSSAPTAASYWKDQRAAFVQKFGAMPAASPPYSEAEAHTIQSTRADEAWAQIASIHSDAVRPTDAFVHWGTGLGDPDVKACYLAAGATEDDGTDIDGNVYPGFSGPTDDATGAYSVATFDCSSVRFPTRPQPPANDAQLGYLYDYLTTFAVPCYLAHGAPVDPAPTRADFIAQYQPSNTGTRWALQSPSAGDGPNPIYDGKNAVCPLTAPGE